MVIYTPTVEEIEEKAIISLERMESFLGNRLKLINYVIEMFTDDLDLDPEYVDKVVSKYCFIKELLNSHLYDNSLGIDSKLSMEKYKKAIDEFT